jgi:hypothetical protein
MDAIPIQSDNFWSLVIDEVIPEASIKYLRYCEISFPFEEEREC